MRILITAGGTREYIDPIRFISNASSGRMGYELARAALRAGHKVTLVTTVARELYLANREAEHRSSVVIIKVESAAEMFDAVKKNFKNCDSLIMAAAVADYTPAKKSKVKIKKKESDLIIKLKPTRDILEWAGKHKNKSRVSGNEPRILVGFALEDTNLFINAEKKLKEKGLDMIIANDISSIGSEKSTVHIKTPDAAWKTIENATKYSIAKKIVYLINWKRNKS
jgi:phosphopantothenoylcysteine decarboxylase/phosphopantothenate--cysteine ligase